MFTHVTVCICDLGLYVLLNPQSWTRLCGRGCVSVKKIPKLVDRFFRLLVGIGQPEKSLINLRLKVIVRVCCMVNS